jgi:uncharacterized membrane protein
MYKNFAKRDNNFLYSPADKQAREALSHVFDEMMQYFCKAKNLDLKGAKLTYKSGCNGEVIDWHLQLATNFGVYRCFDGFCIIQSAKYETKHDRKSFNPFN